MIDKTTSLNNTAIKEPLKPADVEQVDTFVEENLSTETKEEDKLEALHQENESKQDPEEKPSEGHAFNELLKNRKKYLSKWTPHAYAMSSLFHTAVAAALKFSGASEGTKQKMIRGATIFTKLINSLVYSDLAIDAWKNKDAFDFIGRIAEPFLNMFSTIRNYHLLRGVSASLTQLHILNKPHAQNDPNKSMWDNFLDNLNLSKIQLGELFSNKPGKFRAKDHLLGFSSLMQMVTSVIAVVNGSKRNIVDKVVGTLRNSAGFFCDIGLLLRKNPVEKKIGAFFGLHAIFDTMKRFVSKEHEEIIDNLIMPIYNVGMYYFGKVTRNEDS